MPIYPHPHAPRVKAESPEELEQQLRDTCRGKKAYPRRKAACSAAGHLTQMFGQKHVPYHCRWCSKWHLTTTLGRTYDE